MVRPRARGVPSHYVTGFGDGKIKANEPRVGQAMTYVRVRSTHHHQHPPEQQQLPTERQQQPNDDYPGKKKVEDGNYVDGNHRNDIVYSDRILDTSSRQAGPWQSSAVLLLAAVVCISGLFLHVMSDASEKNLRRRRRRRLQPIIVKNKKTDEWIDDADEDSMPEDPEKKEKPTSAPRPPAVYYHPYQPTLQQRQPHGKPSTNPRGVSPTPAAAAASTARAQQQPQQATGEGCPAGSCYGNASATTAYRTPSSKRPLDSSNIPSYSPDIGGVRLVYQNEVRSSLSPPQPHRAVALLTDDLSSFGSLTGEPHQDEEIGYSNTSPIPENGPLLSPFLLSPGMENVEARLGRSSYKTIVLESTPRVTNRKLCVPMSPPLILGGQFTLESTGPTMAFASPSRDRNIKNQPNTDSMTFPPDIPYVPSLSVPHLDGGRRFAPPISVNVDELQLYQMESGDVSHWQARVQQESQIIQDRVFSPVGSSNSSDDVIPSNDPRGSIEHKRDNLTMDTNSAASLQGAIDFDKLELIEVIGGGGFGQVWKAKLRGTPVAVKVLTGSAQAKHVPRAILEEFAAEINLLKGMQHPNICLYMGACVKPPHRAIVTELAANGSLWDALRLSLNIPYLPCDGVSIQGWPLSLYEPDARHGAPPTPGSKRLLLPPRFTWPWKLVKKVAIGVARGMAYLHSGTPPVLHRDLKSANILMDESYNAKVCDFGLSRLKAQGRSMTGNCGTVQWMAPEVLASKPYNEKADVFSFGIICWELLSRQCPYDEMTAIQCALAVLNRDRRPEIPKWCPPLLHALIRSCVKKNPDERPSFEQIIQAFDAMPDV
jgi:hypothetical protein